MDLLNGGHLGNQPAFPGHSFGGNKLTLEQVDPSTFDDDSDDDDFSKGIKPGKKTKGRVKIKMEFIENKLRRYTTFSKRKTGIMKKAYELSTLTGTQVMLLVASETGHVYTFATRKLQPMITSESGKALIQTCLNSPDPPPVAPGQQQAVEQRMNPTGFEETELTYAVDDENGKLISVDGSNGSLKPVYTLSSTNHTAADTPGMVPAQQQAVNPSHIPQGQTYQIATPSSTAVSMTTLVQQPMSGAVNSSPSSTKTSNQGSISLQLPGLPPGIILQPGTSFTIPVQTSNGSQPSSTPQQPTVYRIPAPSQQIITSSGVVQSDSGQRSSASNTSAQQQAMNVITAATPQASPALTPSVFMYQTPQGIVYAPATGPMQDKTIFNLQQPAQALSVQQESTGGQQQGSQQQIITIPVPVSLSGTQQVLQIPSADTGQMQELSQPSAAKKSRK